MRRVTTWFQTSEAGGLWQLDDTPLVIRDDDKEDVFASGLRT
jgi:hypothetical protein